MHSANGHLDFPIQNLPLGVVSSNNGSPRISVAIGNQVFDLRKAVAVGLFKGQCSKLEEAVSGETLNSFMALGEGPRQALRVRMSELLARGASEQDRAESCLHDADNCTMHLPAIIGDYTDFYVGIHHATNVGNQFRPDNPLLPNYKHIPIGYHGRASSICPSGAAVRRPKGQLKQPEALEPQFGPSQRLDYELELGVWMGPGNSLGQPIKIAKAAEHVAGYCLLNDWSARDIQAWEYQPLGPFLGKSFATTLSPWLVTPEALAPFRMPQTPRGESDPAVLPYLASATDQREGGLDLKLEVLLLTARMREQQLAPQRLTLSHTCHMYWSVAQMIAHHTSNGCNLRPGDILGTGTISGVDRTSYGSMLEISGGGKNPISLANGEERSFIEDGDEIILRAHGVRNGYVSIGFGECRAKVLPAI